MKLFWCRHGQAEDQPIDKTRNLTEFGRRQATQVAKYLIDTKQIPTKIYASEYTRAIQTAQIIATSLNLNVTILPNITPNDTVESALTHLEKMQEDSLVVTHQPLWRRTLNKLMQEDTNIYPNTTGLAILSGTIFVPGSLILENYIEGLTK